MRCLAAVLLAILSSLPLRAEGERPGEFDYYLLSLSWSPTWCALEGDARRSPQCADGTGFGWVLHGLWPQNEAGYPSYCASAERPPSRKMTAGMADIMGAPGAAWHQWKKHGTCAGVEADAYFDLMRRAYGRIERPQVLRDLRRNVRLPAAVVEAAFLEANPGLAADQITITCRAERIREARICLDLELNPRRCGGDVIRDCRMTDALLESVR
ncbi:ribonuclease T2 family protein [Pseudooceanicola batsensis HTCC2597]|uniref:Ribonuclease T2 family protein n=1 Tax=Pseudooceanicola batsensis (strain ATCC BAA-863 / DSM 15984 / KCTC 12145 / HTCC2597) TaxID=252305 RepID=A3TVN9_PSEBH|nr:ribonuclease T2 [Pseudooceanicola batsensis]EAQ03685.1 ribonuclease T2 family protein [Pseudooceanicola batsensis HTCC2597]